MKTNKRPARSACLLAWAMLWATTAAAQVQLTTIEDTVYRADGQRFEGIVAVEWRSFLAADSTAVGAYSKNVRVVDGVLRASLVPTTTASTGAYYIARYYVNGRLQFTEYWGVPPSTSLLRLRDVRLVGPPMAGQVAQSPVVGALEIGDIPNLSDELAARVKKGLNYTTSRVAMINGSGDLDGVGGEPTDCVRANGTTGACGVSATYTYVDDEVPAGLLNGTNAAFTLANAPNPPESLQVYRNGLLQRRTVDYTITGNAIQFLPASLPQSGDLLTARYRISAVEGQTGGQAGGALTGYFPAPSIAPGAIADQHVASSAAIQESKLALNFPTHTNANDPSVEQKAALAGTSGAPTGTNRYVTDQDPRLTNSRTPTAHGILSGAHHDTNPAAVSRGDLIVGLGTSPTLWSRLPLGAPNRCLTSNGFDAVWNACLYAGFPAGSLAFVDASGNLTHNHARLYWDNSTRRLAIGFNQPAATLDVHDATPGDGETTVRVKAGEGQSATPLQRWQSFGGSDLAAMGSDGVLQAAAVQVVSTASRPGWQETGATVDPSTTPDGSMWFHSGEQVRKTRDGGQSHPLPQVICSFTGVATNATTMTELGKCTIPAAMVRTGDRFEIRYDVSHEGTAMAFSVAVWWAGTVLVAHSSPATDSSFSGRADALPQGTSVFWSSQNWTSAGTPFPVNGLAAGILAGPVDVRVDGQMSSPTSDTVTLRNLAIVRIPAQQNP